MRIFFVTALAAVLCTPAIAQPSSKVVCTELNQLNTAILTGTISKAQAGVHFRKLIAELQTNSIPVSAQQTWVFPLKGYKSTAIGGSHGNGYSDKGYHYLDGNKHTAHPAHDIFIHDSNQDDIDDRTHKPVDVLAVANGVVIACTNEWQPGSNMRGGKYIYIYHPQQNLITYYAHNQLIDVAPGDEVKAGQKIAEVGRTGYNAYQKRSPTHLHFSAYYLINGLPVPFNCYNQLNQSHYL